MIRELDTIEDVYACVAELADMLDSGAFAKAARFARDFERAFADAKTDLQPEWVDEFAGE